MSKDEKIRLNGRLWILRDDGRAGGMAEVAELESISGRLLVVNDEGDYHALCEPTPDGHGSVNLAIAAPASSRRQKRAISAAAAIHRSPVISICAGPENLSLTRTANQIMYRPTQRQ